MGTTAATVATSPYAISVKDSEDSRDVVAEVKPKLAANGRYVILDNSVIRSERGELDPENEQTTQPKPTVNLYDNPTRANTSRIETYRLARPEEQSEATDFAAYLRDYSLLPGKHKKLRSELPPVQEATRALETQPQKHKPSPKDKGKRKDGNRLTETDIPRLRQQWYDEFSDIFQGAKEELPPLCEVNHEINLIDPDKKYTHRLPTCPIALRPQFYEKLN